MSNEWKVTTLEQSKKLIELGVVLETEHIWFMPAYNPKKAYVTTYSQRNSEIGSYIPAPDAAELLAYLPHVIEDYDQEWILTIRKVHEGYEVEYSMVDIIDGGDCLNDTVIAGDTIVQTLCSTLIWLIEDGYIKL